MNDEPLDRELEAALSVEPSPEFRAKVRARMVGVHMRDGWLPASWRWVAAAACAVGMLAMAGLWLLPSSRAPMPSQVTVTPPVEPLNPQPEPVAVAREKGATSDQVAPAPVSPAPDVAVREMRPSRAPAPAEPEVLISQEEAAALRRLFEAIGNRRLDSAVLPDLEASLEPPMPIEEIVIEPITLAPLARLENE